MIIKLLAPERATKSAFRWRSRLDGSFYTFRMKYQTRFDLWVLDIGATDGTPLLHGLRATPEIDLLSPFKRSDYPPGTLILRDLESSGNPPGRSDFPGKYRLEYETVA